jgi:hypothetical protein
VNNQQIVQQPFANYTSNMWTIVPVALLAGGVQVRNQYNSQCLDIDPTYALDGAKVVQNACNASDPTQWWIRWLDPALPVWHFLNAFTGYYLAVANGSSAAGAGLVQVRYSSSDTAQDWQMW